MTFYAQNGEDRWLAENWEDLDLPDCGIFVDVGAGDGVRISNTKWLEDRGWTGLLIEPDQRHHKNILTNRSASLDSVAIGSRKRPFYLVKDDAEYSGFLRTDGIPAYLPMMDLSSVLRYHKISQIDLLSIDTEGTELEVWDTLDLSQWRPKVVFIEWFTDGIGDNADAARKQLTSDGYKEVAALGCNLVFVDGKS